jgi:hypothetical protein
MHSQKFHILLTNVQNYLGKILFKRRTESSFLSEIFIDSFRREKVFSLGIFGYGMVSYVQ